MRNKEEAELAEECDRYGSDSDDAMDDVSYTGSEDDNAPAAGSDEAES